MVYASPILKIHPNDNVVVALSDLQKNDTVLVDGDVICVRDLIPGKHKVATSDLKKGNPIIMYGILVGRASRDILKGERLSVENMIHDSRDYKLNGVRKVRWDRPDVSLYEDHCFMGYPRNDGNVGTANYWIVVPLVFCENRNIQFMREAMLEELGYHKSDSYRAQVRSLVQAYSESALRTNWSTPGKPLFENIDGIKFLSHTMGCGGMPEDARALCGLLAGYINHPNVAGATILSLGCQDAQTSILFDEINKRNPNIDKPLFLFEQQAYGTERELLQRAIEQTFAGLTRVNESKRIPSPLSKLVIGVECGGSDGFSGLSANPAIGYTADVLVALGGTVILSEFPELCGVEQEILERCVNDQVAERFLSLQRAYAAKAEMVGTGFSMNPSPGNIKDGLITDAMKSAGAVKKA